MYESMIQSDKFISAKGGYYLQKGIMTLFAIGPTNIRASSCGYTEGSSLAHHYYRCKVYLGGEKSF